MTAEQRIAAWERKNGRSHKGTVNVGSKEKPFNLKVWDDGFVNDLIKTVCVLSDREQEYRGIINNIHRRIKQ